jgi:hypothetical protein
VLVREADARVDEGSRAELGACLLGRALEGEVRQEGGGGVVGEGDEEGFGGTAVYSADY